MSRKRQVGVRPFPPRPSTPDVHVQALVDSLQRALKRKVRVIRGRGKAPGRIEVEFYDDNDLTAVAEMLLGQCARFDARRDEITSFNVEPAVGSTPPSAGVTPAPGVKRIAKCCGQHFALGFFGRPRMILHIVGESEWVKAVGRGSYAPR